MDTIVVRIGRKAGRGVKYKHLLEDPDVARWHRSVASGSQITADVYLRRFGHVCAQEGIEPADLLKWDKKRRRDFVEDVVRGMERAEKAGSYIGSTVRAIKSWLAFHDLDLTSKVKIRGAQRTPTLDNERVPTQEELRRVLMAANSRDACVIVLMAHAGLRPEAIGNYRGDDGLRVRDFPELKIEGSTVTFTKIPTMVRVREELSKSRRPYFSFLGQEGVQYIKAYLEERLRKGERISADSDIVTPVWADKAFLTSINVSDVARKAIRVAGFRWRPYVLRAYFDSQLLSAEHKGKVTPAFRQFFMGHVGDIEARYTVGKGRLSDEMVADMREAYRKSVGFLETSKPATASEDELKEAFRKQILAVAGMAPAEVEKMDLRAMTDLQLQQVVAKRLGGGNGGNGADRANGSQQVVVRPEEVERRLASGWEYVTQMADGRTILRFGGG